MRIRLKIGQKELKKGLLYIDLNVFLYSIIYDFQKIYKL